MQPVTGFQVSSVHSIAEGMTIYPIGNVHMFYHFPKGVKSTYLSPNSQEPPYSITSDGGGSRALYARKQFVARILGVPWRQTYLRILTPRLPPRRRPPCAGTPVRSVSPDAPPTPRGENLTTNTSAEAAITTSPTIISAPWVSMDSILEQEPRRTPLRRCRRLPRFRLRTREPCGL